MLMIGEASTCMDNVVDMPDLTGGDSSVEIDFNGPEIHVVARDETTWKNYNASIDFIYDT